MDRREFLKKSMQYLSGITSAYILSQKNHLFGEDKVLLPYDLVAVKGGEPDVMFDHAIAAMGGIEKFVKKGQVVIVKPNIGWSLPPERGANTHPKLVKRIVEHCVKAGAKKVIVFDNSASHWQDCYKISGIERAVKEAGGVMAPANLESYYHPVEIKNGKNLKKTKVHELYLEGDVVINVPILKNHWAAGLTVSIKNLMGVVWDRWYYHGNNLSQCIADFCLVRKPTLNVVDAYYVLMQHGPRGNSVNDVEKKKMLILSADMVAADSAAAKTFGTEPDAVKHIQIAGQMKIGNSNLEKLNIKRIVLS